MSDLRVILVTGLPATGKTAPGRSFLNLPGERFVHDGAAGRRVIVTIDDWWNRRTIPVKKRPALEPRR